MKKRKRMTVDLRDEQWEKLERQFARSSDVKFTAFIRKRLMGDPVTVFYRDRAFDELVELGVQFKEKVLPMLQHSGLGEADKNWLKDKIDTIIELTIKINEDVRICKKNQVGGRSPGLPDTEGR